MVMTTTSLEASAQPDIDDLVPRRYQEEVYTKAQKGNIIAALNTGSGKTLISLLLIKWTAAQAHSRGKVIIFLVPKVALVEQQGNYLAKNTPLKVKKLHGALDLDLSDRPGWKNRFESYDVFVMTAQILVNFITHSLWSIDKISLLIFDECHHARKNHPYNTILREYFQVRPSSQRPKIFGMTASPIWNVREPLTSLSTLEANMNAKIVGVRDHVEELHKHSAKPLEVISEYPMPPEEYDYPSPTIHQTLQIIDNSVWDQLGIPWSNINMRYIYTFDNLGPYCASLFLYLEIQYHIEGFLVKNKGIMMEAMSDIGDMEVDVPIFRPSKKIPMGLYEVVDILADFQSFFPANHSSPTIPISIDLKWCTPKVRQLVDILKEYYTSNFQGIIFVEQRQVASALAKVLQVIPDLQGKINCAYLVGTGVNSDGVSKMTDRYAGDAIEMFRKHEINLLIATSVAEEGLDFHACDLVVRFDLLHHMVGYVQSRGRARKTASTFVVMIPQDDLTQLAKYESLQQSEPEVNRIYQTRHKDIDNSNSDDDDDETHPVDLSERERYVIPSTGAILTYDISLSLLNSLCSLVPRDSFTSAHVPKYEGDFQTTLHLPRALPLAPADLVYTGPFRRSKREARRAVAFLAVKRLLELDVFDGYLLPMSTEMKMDVNAPEMNSRTQNKVTNIPVMLTVSVRDPWCMGPKLWIHPIVIDGQTVAGLVTGTSLPLVEVMDGPLKVQLLGADPLHFEVDYEHQQRMAMEEFTRRGVWYTITSSPFQSSLSFYIVPVTANKRPDFEAMDRLLANPLGSSDWSRISETHYDQLTILNRQHFGRTYRLRRIRSDLSPLSAPLPGSREDSYPTYHEYWMVKWSKKTRQAIVPFHGPLLEVSILPRSNMALTSLDSLACPLVPSSVRNGALLPRDACVWIDMSFSVRKAFESLPVLCRRITDVYRACSARFELGLPLIPDKLVIEALTIPSAGFPYSNQRLETLGDAVLQVCTTVHLFNHYPNRHEGQLTQLRQKAVNNRYLLHRALDIGLERFLISEGPSVHKWRYTLADGLSHHYVQNDLPVRYVTREYPRRSLQDSMEAMLGAGFLAGGIEMALRTGTALGLEFGGLVPWHMRYPDNTMPTSISALFAGVEKNLGYQFRHNELLLEALTHPSFALTSEGPSYQRLEFLGDAILDLAVIKYLYDKFPDATSHQLAFPRTKAICAPSLASIAVRRLGLHKMMLVNSMDLSIAIDHYVPILESIPGEEIVRTGWKFDPPKALSDVFESVIGAVLLDSGYDYEKTAAVVEYIMEDVLEALSPSLAKDPISQLMEWTSGAGCRRSASFEKRTKNNDVWEREGIVVMVHSTVIIGPIVSGGLNVAKFIAAERALAILKDSGSEKSLARICDCATPMYCHGIPSMETLSIAGVESLIGNPLEELLEQDDVEKVEFILTQTEDPVITRQVQLESGVLNDHGNLIPH
ncbi:hypothetical protein B0H34DRAFT_693086 [Crassisporium funariophilum]|nr:hypothetical protein B0H34DRAFT_693086 [Crassisporium funariophilum]